jgi:hypothetical protein
MLSMVLVLAFAAGDGSCAEHRAAEAAQAALLQALEAEAYLDAAVDFESRIDELGLAGSTLAREEALAASDRAADLDGRPSLDWGGRHARRTARSRTE